MKIFITSAVLIMFSAVILSCNVKKDVPPPAQPSYLVMNASPDAPAVDIFVNSNLLEENVPFGSYTVPYTNINSGLASVTLNESGTTNTLVNTNLEFKPDKKYSLFAIDSLSSITLVIVADSFSAPATDSSKLRFLNFVPNSPVIDFGTTNGDVLFFSRTFNDQENNTGLNTFITLASGIYNFEIRNASDSGNLVYSMPGTLLESGRVYTIASRGFFGGSGSEAFQTSKITNY